MAGAIKGITIEFRGDTTSLDRALSNVKKEAKGTANELKYIDKAIKFNPTSVDAWRQKQIVLNKAINETKEKLNLMKQGLKAMEAQGLNAENSEEFRKMQREIDQTERHLKSLQNELKGIGNVNLRAASEQFKQWGSSLENAGQKMRGLSLAAAAVAGSIGALTVKSGKWADDLNTMSKRYGVGTTELQKYSVAADLVDTSTEAIAKSQTKLKKSMLSAEQGSKNQAAAFEKLGIQVTNADGSLRDGETVWQETISALGEMSNETERDALAMQLMGKSASELNPLIEDGGETYKRVSDTLKKYGLDFIDQETLDNANKFNDELDTIKAIGVVAFQSIGAELAGYLAPALEKVVEWVGKFAQWVGNLSPKVLTIVAAVAGLVAVLAPLLIGLGKVSMGISALISLFAKISGALGLAQAGFLAAIGPILAIVAAIGVVVAAFKHLWDTNEEFRAKMTFIWNFIKQTIAKFVNEASTKIQELIAIFAGGSGSIKDAWEKFCNFLAPMFETVFTAIAIVVRTVLDAILGILDVFIAVFQGDWSAAWEAVKNLFSIVWNGIVGLFSQIWKIIITLVKANLTVMKTVITTVFNAIKTLIQSIWNKIKNAISNAIVTARNKVVNTVSALKNSVINNFNSLKSKVSSVWNGIKSAIVSPIQKAWNLVKSAVDKINGIFPIHLGKIFSGIQLPHFKISGGTPPWGIGGKGTKPSVSIEWYAKGGIFKKPTVFATPNGLKGVGEAGAEAVVPLAELWKQMANMGTNIAEGVAKATGDEITINVYAQPGMDIKALAEEIERRMVESQKRRKVAWQ